MGFPASTCVQFFFIVYLPTANERMNELRWEQGSKEISNKIVLSKKH